MRSHSKAPIEPSELPDLVHVPVFEGFLELTKATMAAIKKICPNTRTLLYLWHNKNSADTYKDHLSPEDKDSYERTDFYNIIGFSVYLLQHLNSFEEKPADIIFPSGWNPDYTFELLQPMLAELLEQKFPAIKHLAVRSVALFAYMLQGKTPYENVGHHYDDAGSASEMALNLFELVGKHTMPDI